MNVVIIGAGKLGTLLTKHLSQENHDVVIIDKNSSIILLTNTILLVIIYLS